VIGAGMRNFFSRQFKRGDVLPAFMTVVAMAVGAVIYGFFMLPYSQQVGYDEGYEAAATERVISGHWLPYVDAVSHRGPFLYWTQAIFHLITGRFQWTGTRLMGLMALVVTTGASFLTGWAAGWPLAGAIAAVTNVLVLATIYEPGGSVGVHGEPVAIAYLMIAMVVVAYALYRMPATRRRTIALVVGGVLVGVAGLTKQTLAIACVPMSVWIFAHIGCAQDPDRPNAPLPLRAGFLKGVLPFALGGIGLIALLLLRYAIAGHLGTLFYWSFTFNAQVYMEPYKGRVLELVKAWFYDQPWAIVGVAVTLAIAFGRPASFIQRFTFRDVAVAMRSGAFEMTVGVIAVALLWTAATPLRLWPHYFVPIFPFFGLTLGVAIERLMHRGGTVNWPAQLLVGVAVVGMLLLVGERRFSRLTDQKAHGSYINPRPDPACRELNRLDGGGRQPVFMWGILGDLYITCRRPSVSKFTYTTVVAGIVPPFWDDRQDSRVPAGVRETLLKELTTAAPTVIMDHPMGARASMMDFPVFESFVRQRYCLASTMSDLHGRSINFFARRDLAACRGK
jgi:hypothetical protein